MRLGIDYRFLASRQDLVNRGIGRYTQQQLRHVLELDTDNEYLLLCPREPDLSLVLPEIRGAANVSVCADPPAEAEPGPDPLDRRGLLRRAAAYQDWVAGLAVDLYHSTAPFWLEQTSPPAFDACPMVATVYDFIPLVFPSAYLTDPRRRAAYAGAAHLVTSASRLIAISEGTREDAAHYLGFPREAIDCAWPFADPCFRPLPDEEVAARLGRLTRRVGLPARFVLTVAALHYSKNLELVMGAYGRLSPPFRGSLPLVVACHLDDWGMAHVRRLAGTFGVADDIVLTGYVSDDELAALYNRATVVVHPARYEGFGLPIVEAMQCGAAVVTTKAPSLPEVAGGAAVLVDPEDPTALAAAIEGLVADPARRRRMGEKGLERAAAFTPEALARNTIESYRRAVQGDAPVTIALRSNDAWRALDVVRILTDGGVEVFTDDRGAAPDQLVDMAPVHHVNALARCRPDVVLDTDELGAPVPVGDPYQGRPALHRLLARGRLGWPADRFVALAPDTYRSWRAERPQGSFSAPGTVEVVVASPGDDELVACDVVVCGSAPDHALLMRAGAAATPVVQADRLPEVAADPDELRRQSAAARAWYEAEAARIASIWRKRAVLPAKTQAPADCDNKLCEVEDLLAGGDVLGWCTARAVRAVGTLGRTASVLCLGVPSIDAAFALTCVVREVTLAALWMAEGGGVLARALLVDPSLVATGPFESARLVVRHAEPARLPFPDACFDAVVSCAGLEPQSCEDAAAGLGEAARVVRPGGIVTLAASVRLHGPRRSPGLPVDWVGEHLVPGAGLGPVGAIRTEVSAATLTDRRRLARAFDDVGPPLAGRRPLTVSNGALLGALHLTLRKTGGQASG